MTNHIELVRENPSEWEAVADVLAWADRQAEKDCLYIAVDLHRILDTLEAELAEWRDRAYEMEREHDEARVELAQAREERDEARENLANWTTAPGNLEETAE